FFITICAASGSGGMEGNMKLYRLGELTKFDSMVVFHAMAHLGMEGLIIVSPKEPIVSVGYFQDLNTSIDIEYCNNNGIGVIRREIGGGTTLLDRNQIFYQLIINKSSLLLPKDTFTLYRQFSQPVIDTYRELGINVKYKEVNDLITEEGRKITGEGGANIGDAVVFVGGLLLDFDYELMSRVFAVKNEEYRKQVLQSLENNVTTVKRELGYIPPKQEIEDKLIKNFEKLIGWFSHGELTDEIWAKARELEGLYTSEAFLNKKGKEQQGIKISSRANMFEKRHKAVGGTIHAVFEVAEGLLSSVNLYGDFTFLPKEKLNGLEKELIGLPLDKQKLRQRIEEYYANESIDCPGVSPEDFATVFFD
ncbi:MAG: lipoate--protein ligase, partial [Bacillota bacterium]|nr:lipoate--protein ligase [Bacillota bacterium]